MKSSNTKIPSLITKPPKESTSSLDAIGMNVKVSNTDKTPSLKKTGELESQHKSLTTKPKFTLQQTQQGSSKRTPSPAHALPFDLRVKQHLSKKKSANCDGNSATGLQYGADEVIFLKCSMYLDPIFENTPLIEDEVILLCKGVYFLNYSEEQYRVLLSRIIATQEQIIKGSKSSCLSEKSLREMHKAANNIRVFITSNKAVETLYKKYIMLFSDKSKQDKLACHGAPGYYSWIGNLGSELTKTNPPAISDLFRLLHRITSSIADEEKSLKIKSSVYKLQMNWHSNKCDYKKAYKEFMVESEGYLHLYIDQLTDLARNL